MMEAQIKEKLKTGQVARLIPVVADSKKEERATSILLASFMVVPEFAREILKQAEAPINSRTSIESLTEISFKEKSYRNIRPDGLIIVKSGKKEWKAIVEAKIGNTEISEAQVLSYIDLARSEKIDAIITMSNQFVTHPSHIPLQISKSKTRNINLFHFSWLFIKSAAVLIIENKKIDDPEQAYILSELIRYFDHESSGVSSLTKMPTEWKDFCSSVQQGVILDKKSDILRVISSSWQQLIKHMALTLSMKIGEPVSQYLSRKRLADSDFNIAEDADSLIKNSILEAYFDIPNAAARVGFHVDFLRRTISYSMLLDVPQDKSRTTAPINWFTRQLKNKENIDELILRAHWPKRQPITTAKLTEVLTDPYSLVPENISDLPSSIEIVRIIDLMGKFKGAKVFVEESTCEFVRFYHDVGQHMSKWQPKAPQIKNKKKETNELPNIMTPKMVENNEAENRNKSLFGNLLGL